MSNLPKTLYKFAPPRGADILEQQCIHLCHADAFNDPFDFNPCIRTNVTIGGADGKPFVVSGARVMPTEMESFLKSTVILSLTEHRDSLLMWAHYAAAHTGLVIGFDPS